MSARVYEDLKYKEIMVNKGLFNVVDAPTLLALREGRMLLVTYSTRDIRAKLTRQFNNLLNDPNDKVAKKINRDRSLEIALSAGVILREEMRPFTSFDVIDSCLPGQGEAQFIQILIPESEYSFRHLYQAYHAIADVIPPELEYDEWMTAFIHVTPFALDESELLMLTLYGCDKPRDLILSAKNVIIARAIKLNLMNHELIQAAVDLCEKYEKFNSLRDELIHN